MTNRYPQPMDQARAAILKLLLQAPYSHQGIKGNNLKNICPQFSFLRDSIKNQLIHAMAGDGLIYLRKDTPPRDSYSKCTIFDAGKKPLVPQPAISVAAPLPVKTIEETRIVKAANIMQPTPEKLREQASEMLKRAEQMEKNDATRDAIKKSLIPALRDVMQAKHAAQQAVDAIVDTIADLEKASARFESVVQEVLS